MAFNYEELKSNLEQGNAKKVSDLVLMALESGEEASKILNNGLISAMNDVGIKFKEGEFFVPEVLVAAKAMQEGLNVLNPILAADNVDVKKGTIVIGTVKGDLHDIGKRLVAMMMQGSGFEIVDLGTDVPPQKFVEKVKEIKPNLVGMSAMLTTTMPYMKQTIEELKAEGLYEKVKVMIGGAPVSEKYAKDIGAHYSFDAPSAVELANNLIACR